MGEKKELETASVQPETKAADTKAVDTKAKKDVKKKDKKPNIFIRFGRKCKEVFSELKKVTWPTFAKVVKNTGIVLAVVAIFVVFITAFDTGLLEAIKALLKIDVSTSSSTAAAFLSLLGL